MSLLTQGNMLLLFFLLWDQDLMISLRVFAHLVFFSFFYDLLKW